MDTPATFRSTRTTSAGTAQTAAGLTATLGLADPDRHRALVGSRTHATDVKRHRCWGSRQAAVTTREKDNDRSQDRNP